ncbi:MAG: DJ-1/PfpI family protein [Clostridiales bacterium]|nr:DJ-1/PfpI family protein [Clostridiales bacterium]
MSKAYIFFAQGFEEIEGLIVVDVLRRGGAEINMVSVSEDLYVTSSHGVTVKCDSLFSDNNYEDGDMLVLPGGMPGTKNLAAHAELMELVRKYSSDGKRLAAICAAPSILGELGLLKGKRATCFPGFEDKLFEAKVTAEKVVTDGNITTGKGMGAGLLFGLELLAILEGTETADKIAKAVQYL